MNSSPQLREIFAAALGINSAADRQKYLDQACAGDAALRDEVESLLSAHGDAGSFMLDADPDATVQAPPIEDLVGETIGPYKLREQLGEGGFGVVYVAEQTEPVRRKVALKVIKPGMDTKDVIARFEAERQALALMDHPHIAKVLDAGATEQGRPYFVMELVKGVPVTRFCDEARLDTRERLELFIKVCQAVQHAHQKGIIHRDIKPSNVLVTLHDGVPVPKVIDFGVAKALNQRLTDQTVYTHVAQMVGTPLYMSPEQAEYSGLDIDTRTDIYSLGVLLYELLTGTTPFDREAIKRAGFNELRRIIREDEPPRPSARISTLAGDLRSTVCDRRKVDSRKLSQSLRGDLDWIVMRTLEKDRNRRYETANALVRDIERYLGDEPVEACPPSVVYRLRKFARRNRLAFGTIAATIAVLLVGVVGLSVANARIEEEQKQTEAALATSDANLGKALAAIDRMLQRPSEVLMVSAGPTSVQITLLQEGLDLCEELAQDDPDDPRIRYQTARIQFVLCFRYAELGDIEKATEASQKAVTMLQRLREEDPHDPRYIFDLAMAYCQFGGRNTDIEDGIEWYRKSVALLEDLIVQYPDNTDYKSGLVHSYLGLSRYIRRDPETKLSYVRKAITLGESDAAVSRGALGSAYCELAVLLKRAQPAEAEQAIRNGIRLLQEEMTNPWVGQQSHYRAVLAFAHRKHAELLVAAAKWEVALSSYREAIAIDKLLSADFPEIPRHWEHLLRDEKQLLQLLTNDGRIDEDVEHLAEDPPAQTAQDSSHTARVTQIDAILDEMRDTVNRSSELLAENPDHPRFAEIAIAARRGLADAYMLLGRVNEALEQLDQVSRITGDDQREQERLDYYASAIAENPRDLDARRERSRIRVEQQEWGAVIEDLTVVVEEDPDDIESRLTLSEAYLRTGQNDAAIEQADEVTLRDPDNAVAYGRRGRAWIGKGNHGEGAVAFDNALAQLNEAVRMEPETPWAYSARGEAHACLGHWAEAAADFQVFCDLGPDNRGVWQKVAVLELFTGDIEGYREFCRSLLSRWDELDEDNRHTLSHFCLSGPGVIDDMPAVVDWTREHLEQQPNNPYWNQFYRGALVRTGEYQQAIDHFTTQDTTEGLWFRDKVWLTIACYHVGQTDEAARWLDEAVSEFAESQGSYWFDRLEKEVLINEATRLIKPSPESEPET